MKCVESCIQFQFLSDLWVAISTTKPPFYVKLTLGSVGKKGNNLYQTLVIQSNGIKNLWRIHDTQSLEKGYILLSINISALMSFLGEIITNSSAKNDTKSLCQN